MKGIIRAYGLGGAGFNVLKFALKLEKGVEGFADINPCFIDTSLSNIALTKDSGVKEEDVFILEDKDGSGKRRDANYEDMAKNVKHILHRFPAGDLNLVVSSASGGSGSIASALITKELLANNHPTIVILIGSEESKIAIENTVKSLQSLDTISRKQVDKPVVVSYFHNSQKTPRAENDKEIRQFIMALSILASRENLELDTADLANFVGFENVTSVKEGLSIIYLTSKEDEALKIEYPIAIASLFAEQGQSADNLTPEYACVGYVPASVKETLKGGDLHFVISQHEVKSLYEHLTKRLASFKESAAARTSTSALLQGDADDNGIVL